MILFIGILLILYGIVAQKKYSVQVGMLFVLLVMGFQEGIPGDYMGYKETYTSGHVDVGMMGSTAKETEFAFIWSYETFSRMMNFHWFVLLTAIVQCLAMGLMIKKYADKKYWYFGVLLIFFTFNIMMIQMKAMRQGYAVDCLLLAYYLLGKRKYIWALVPAVLAYGFHNSSIIAIPFFVALWGLMFLRGKDKLEVYAPASVNKQKGYGTAIWVTGGLFAFYVLKFVVFANYINPFLEGLDAFEYSGYLEAMEERSVSWWILLYHLVIVFAVALYYVNEKDFFRKYLALLTLVAMFLNLGTFGFGNLMRVPAYFLVFTIVVFPNVAGMFNRSYGKQFAVGFVLFTMLYVMYGTVGNMLSMNTDSGTGFGPFTFSFLNW